MIARTKHILWVCLLILGIASGGSVVFLWSRAVKPSDERVDTPKPFNPSAWAWRNEEHWAVEQMTRDIVELTSFAAHVDPSKLSVTVTPTKDQTYRVSLQGGRLGPPLAIDLTLQEHLWNPRSFAPLVTELLHRLPVHKVEPPQTGILQSLLAPGATEIEGVQAKVSNTLTSFPGSARAHEEAALVLGVMGLFEEAGAFQDHRFILCRMAAHLAMAEALRTGAVTPEGRLAATSLLTLAGRKGQANREIQILRQDPAIPQAWTQTLYMLTTEDWRSVEDASKVSLAEALAAFRARCYSMDANRGADWLLASNRRDVPWGYAARVVMRGSGCSVSTGRQLIVPSLDWDSRDLQAVNSLRQGGPLDSDAKVCAALGKHPTRCWNPESHQLEVIGWGLWAQHFQALFLDDMMRTIHFYDGMFGSKSDTATYLDTLERRFSGLEQFPVLQKRYSNIRPEVYDKAILKAAYFAQQHPELLADCSWTCINHAVETHPQPKALPRYQDWLTIPMPFGTTYNWNYRIWEISEKERLTKRDTADFLALNPFDLSIAGYYLYVRFPDRHYDPKEVEIACAATKDFNRMNYLERMRSAYPEHSPEALEVLRSLSALDSEYLFGFGDELARLKREQEASAAFLSAFEKVENRIMVSNDMTWEVLYLNRTGQTAKAEEIAEECADVYSYRGLETLATLRETQGRLEEAEREYAKIAKRYDDDYVIPAFHYRNRNKSQAYSETWAQECLKYFPRGLQSFSEASGSLPPTEGLVLQDDNAYLRRRGVSRDAVIVAMDGYKIGTKQQFYLIRTFNWEKRMNLGVFQNGKYQTIHLDTRFLNINLLPYHPSKGGKP